MRILHLVSSPLFSGAVPPTVGLALAQRQLGHTVWLAIDCKRGNYNGYEEAAAPRLQGMDLAPPVPLVLSTKSTPMQLWQDVQRLRRWLHSGAVDVVHVHLSHDHALVAMCGAPQVRRVRTFHAARSLRRRPGQVWLSRRADAWIVRCDRHKDTLVHGFSLPAAHIAVVPGSVDAAEFMPCDARARLAARQSLHLPVDVPLLGHVALMANRGQEELLAALHQLADAAPHVLFVGRGEAETALKRRADGLGLSGRVHFAGYLQGEALHRAYAALDAAFVAQPGNDAAARAALEAMAAGLPLLAVRDGALAELVHENVGYPIASRTPEAIAEAILGWVGDRQTGAARGAAGRAYVSAKRRFADEAQTTLALYGGS